MQGSVEVETLDQMWQPSVYRISCKRNGKSGHVNKKHLRF
jgi:hypothetical protein